MQEILFYNIVYVYVYVCKTSEEKFGGCWWSFSWLDRKVQDHNYYAQLIHADQVDLATSFC